MSNKEMLAELKICYELLNDIHDNNEERFDNDIMTEIEKINTIINKLYENVYQSSLENEEDREDLKIKLKVEHDSDIVIADNVYDDYQFVKKDTFEPIMDEYGFRENEQCNFYGYYWYLDEIGYKHNNHEYERLANGLLKALDEMSIQGGNEFDYVDKTCELTDMTQSDALYFLDEFGGDNEED